MKLLDNPHKSISTASICDIMRDVRPVTITVGPLQITQRATIKQIDDSLLLVGTSTGSQPTIMLLACLVLPFLFSLLSVCPHVCPSISPSVYP